MFAVVYKFEVRQGKEALFSEARHQLTFLFRAEAGALGSRLHQSDSEFWAYAQWPNEEAWEQAELSKKAAVWRDQMKESLLKSAVVFKGQVKDDLLL